MKKTAMEIIVENLSTILKKTGMSENSLAAKAHVDQKTVNNLMNYDSNRSSTKVDTAEKIARALGLELWELSCPGLKATAAPNSPINEQLLKSVGKALDEIIKEDGLVVDSGKRWSAAVLAYKIFQNQGTEDRATLRELLNIAS